MAHILIIDDSATERHVFRAMLEGEGHQVSEATGGQEGVQKARELKPQVVLMDLVMPGMDGFKATRELHSDDATKNIPIIIISTKDQETDQVWAARQGAVDYLVKPVDRNELKKMLKKHLG